MREGTVAEPGGGMREGTVAEPGGGMREGTVAEPGGGMREGTVAEHGDSMWEELPGIRADGDGAAERLKRAGLSLERTTGGLALTDGTLTLTADFTRLLPRLKEANLRREMLVRSARVRGVSHPSVLDATAGFGEDSMLLAAAGCTVTLFENDPVIAALLSDALRRAHEEPALAEAAGRMTLIFGDSIEAMKKLGKRRVPAEAQTIFPGNRAEVAAGERAAGPDRTPATEKAAAPDWTAAGEAQEDAGGVSAPDVIVLDPMFPERQKSALIKKKFQLLQKLERPCADEEELLLAALGAGAKKVIVKRPLKGPYLAGKKPSYSKAGKSIRYDGYVL